MGLISGILISLGLSGAVQAGRKLVADQGWMPAAYYHNLAAEAVEQGDLDTAIRNNLRARLRNREFAPALAQRDMLEMRVVQRQQILREELEQISDRAKSLEKELCSLLSVFRLNLILVGTGGLSLGFVLGLWLCDNGCITSALGMVLSGCGVTGFYLPKRSDLKKQQNTMIGKHRRVERELEEENLRRTLLAE